MSDEPIVQEEEIIPECVLQEMTSLDHDLSNMDRAFDNVSDRRERILSKLDPVMDAMQISTDPETLESQTKLVDTYSRLLKDVEDNHYKRVSVKLRKKQDEKTDDITNAIVAISRIDIRGAQTMNGFNLTPEEKQKVLEHQFSECGCVPIGDMELTDDHRDVQELSDRLKAEAEESAVISLIDERKL